MAMTVYAGGPIDYARPHDKIGGWQHQLEAMLFLRARVFCPACAYVPGEEDAQTMVRNLAYLGAAELSVFLLDGVTYGTPVEINWKMAQADGSKILIVHPSKPGLFVRSWARNGAIVVHSMEEAMSWLRTHRLVSIS